MCDEKEHARCSADTARESAREILKRDDDRPLPGYGQIPWKQLGRDVVYAMYADRRDYEFDPTYYEGHQMVPQINFNSLARIVDKYRWYGIAHLRDVPQPSAGNADGLVAKWRGEAGKHIAASNDDDCGKGTEEWCLHREASRIYSQCAEELAAITSEVGVYEALKPFARLGASDCWLDHPNEFVVCSFRDEQVTIGDLRKAALALSRVILNEPQPPSKMLTMLAILDAAGGQTEASDSKWCWLNYFCEDAEPVDTFNQAIDAKFIRVLHDSRFDSSTAYLTDEGRAALAVSRPKDK